MKAKKLLLALLTSALLIPSTALAQISEQEFIQWAKSNKMTVMKENIIDLLGNSAKVPEATVADISHTFGNRCDVYIRYNPSGDAYCYMYVRYDLGGKDGYEPKTINLGIDGQLKQYPIAKYEFNHYISRGALGAFQHNDYKFEFELTPSIIDEWNEKKISGVTVSSVTDTTAGLVISKYPKDVEKFNLALKKVVEYKALEKSKK